MCVADLVIVISNDARHAIAIAARLTAQGGTQLAQLGEFDLGGGIATPAAHHSPLQASESVHCRDRMLMVKPESCGHCAAPPGERILDEVNSKRYA